MLKLGIYQLPQLLTKGTDYTLFRKELKNISIELYDEVCNIQNPDELAERILLSFSDDRGAYKRTNSRRFEVFDRKILELLKHHAQCDHLIVHDAGVSDARTSRDFFEKLSKLFKELKFYASDYNPEIRIIQNSSLKIAINQEGKILQIVYPPFVFNVPKRDSYRHYPLNHLVRFYIQYVLIPLILKRYKTGNAQSVKDIQLFCPAAKRLAKTNPRFHLIKHNLLDPSPTKEPVHILRAMNVLNDSYFSIVEMKLIVGRIFDALSEGGFLITGSNEGSDSTVHGSIYQKKPQKFEKLWQSGNGSSIENKIMQFGK